jgi:hypothetical protein
MMLPHAQCGLPAGSYGFLEWYCTDPTCDCHRVLLQVCEERRPSEVLATINFGWEPVEFYAQWLHGDEQYAKEIVTSPAPPIVAPQFFWFPSTILPRTMGQDAKGSYSTFFIPPASDERR